MEAPTDMRPYTWLACALAVLLVIWVAPQSRWSPKNHFDVFAGRWKPGFYGPEVQPVYLLDSENYTSQDFETRLLRAISKSTHEEIFPLADERPNDPSLQAHALRLGSVWARVHPPTTPALSPDMARTRAQVTEDVIRIASRGEKIEPENGFFPLIKAVALWSKGEKTAARAALQEAVNCSRFDEHLLDEADLRIRVLERHHGYRGELVRMFELASVLLPHYAVINTLGEAINKEGTLQDRRNWLTVARKLADETSVGIGILVAVKMAYHAVTPKEAVARQGIWRREDALASARRFDAQLRSGGVTSDDSAVEIIERLLALRDQASEFVFQEGPFRSVRYVLFTSSILAALLIGIPAALLVAGMHRRVSESMRPILLHLAAAAAWLLILVFATSSGESLLPNVALLHLVLAFFYGRRSTALVAVSISFLLSLVPAYDGIMSDRFLDLLPTVALVALGAFVMKASDQYRSLWAGRMGLMLSLAGLLVSIIIPYAIVPAVIYALGYWWNRSRKPGPARERPVLAAVTVTILALLAGAFFILTVTRAHDSVTFSLVTFLLAVVILGIVALNVAPTLNSVGIAAFGISILYMGGVALELMENSSMRLANAGFVQEAEAIRRAVDAGKPTYSP
jgi:hypothetical protein